jgi:hypothetical protein
MWGGVSSGSHYRVGVLHSRNYLAVFAAMCILPQFRCTGFFFSNVGKYGGELFRKPRGNRKAVLLVIWIHSHENGDLFRRPLLDCLVFHFSPPHPYKSWIGGFSCISGIEGNKPIPESIGTKEGKQSIQATRRDCFPFLYPDFSV